MTTGAISSVHSSIQSQLWNGEQLAGAFTHAAAWLDAHHEQVNALNVFPVPDGDTGTNMAMTMKSAIQAIGEDAQTVAEVGRRLAYGALMGARGNSGVILSQIFRGFASGIEERDELDGRDLAKALTGAQEMAYKAVMRPVEGTMLTVIRGAAERATAAAKRTSSLATVLNDAIDGAQHALDSTPDLLDILRQAGVVDAGGQGIVLILEGLERYTRGDLLIDESELSPLGTGADMAFLDHGADLHGEEEFGYCTNFMVFGDGFDFERVRDDIAAMGQSAVIVGDGEMLKVHIHTENPGRVLDYAIGLGTLDQIKIDNMAKQTATLAEQRATAMASHNSGTVDAVPVSIAIVAVASGEGLADALRTMGATCIVRGGQTMNPSTEDLLKAVEQAPCDDVILLPNNKNIILTANQVANLTERSVQVVPTISVPQALAALASFRTELSLDANVATMTGALENVLSLEITKAVRDVELNGVRIANGQTIGLIDDELAAAGNDAAGVARTLFARAAAGKAELITVFSGNDASNNDIAALRQVVEDAFPGVESDFQVGGQPHYLFVIGVE
ncbi:MAG: DAK2 domain-containing protein [Thermomicrobiales bacterium]